VLVFVFQCNSLKRLEEQLVEKELEKMKDE